VESRASTAHGAEAGSGGASARAQMHGHRTTNGHDPVGLGLSSGRVERLNPGSAPG
jgi:hypothetical protein